MRSSILITVIASLLPLTGWAEVFPDSLAAPHRDGTGCSDGYTYAEIACQHPRLTKVISADDIRKADATNLTMTYYNKSFQA